MREDDDLGEGDDGMLHQPIILLDSTHFC
jgi:hypothetical protein